MPEQRKCGVCHFFTQLVAMATSLEISKRGPDHSSAPKMLSFGEKNAKIGPTDPEIIVLREIIKESIKNRTKLRKIKYIAQSAT